jgi:hypothetical protein
MNYVGELIKLGGELTKSGVKLKQRKTHVIGVYTEGSLSDERNPFSATKTFVISFEMYNDIDH